MDRGEEESSKGNSISNSDSNIHFHHQLHSDFALALALHQQQLLELQETAFTYQISSTNPFHYEEEEVEESDDENSDDDDDDHDIDTSLLFNGELGYLDGEDSNNNQNVMEEDDIDPDELSYEELIALGEMVGEESRGLSAEEISSCLTPYSNPISTTTTTSVTFDKDDHNDRCVICQVEYGNEEDEEDDDRRRAELVALPCNHPFHSQCISKWLFIKKICPICNAEVSPSNITCKSTRAS